MQHNISINCRGKLFTFDEPRIMGIINVTPDSFWTGSRTPEAEAIRQRVQQIRDEGGEMIDLGAYSSRPGASDVPAEEEMRRLRLGMQIIREEWTDVPVSIDTFRADVARMAVEECGADIINDISGGDADNRMFRTVANLHVPYVLMHMQGTPQDMQVAPHYDDVLREVVLHLATRIDRLQQMGVADIIVDPGFGFGKTIDHNYELMKHLEAFHEFRLPLLVGISRKSMIYKLFGTTPAEALNGTTVLNTIALLRGAHILRVHDVAAAAEAKKIVSLAK